MDTRTGWMVVAAAFCVNAVVFGITYSFGVLFDALAAEFGTGRSATANTRRSHSRVGSQQRR